MVSCSKCERQYEYDKKKGHTRTVCNSCVASNRRFILKEKYLQYKGGKCEMCGYCKSKRALTFHHVDPTQKEFQISGAHTRSWDSLKSELDKCMLLCMNCHMEEHERLDSISKPVNQDVIDEELRKFDIRTGPKKEKEFNKCPVCDTMKNVSLKHCSVKCAGISNRKVDWDNINLLELMNKHNSILAVSKILGISDNAVKKRMIKLGLWSKKKFKK